jgi:hypothetical protein
MVKRPRSNGGTTATNRPMPAAVCARLDGRVMTRSERAAISTAARKLGTRTFTRRPRPIRAERGVNGCRPRSGDAHDDMAEFEISIEGEPSVGSGMSGPHQRDEAIVIEATPPDARGRFVDHADDRVRSIAFQRFEQRWSRWQDVEVECGRFGGETDEQMGRQGGGLQVGHQQAHMARSDSRIERACLQHLADVDQDSAQRRPKFLGARAKDVSRPRPHQQRIREKRAQPPERPTGRGLAHPEAAGGPRDTSFLKQSVERHQQVQIDAT